ncbi:hypothetical protein AB0I75_18710 [Streptomyces sp. NPDC050273]|uniref:hypothetical protein n=1 Tax=Streptomyces sp. NPDC050273 TaxID=3154933 RepID=UPI003439907B
MSFADQVQALRLRKLKVLNDHHKKVQKLERALDTQLEMIDLVLTQVADASDKLPCLVRTTPGPELTIYHSEDAPCGRVYSRQNFAVMAEADAMDASPYAYLERCTACKWQQAAKIHGVRMMVDK